jgi:hypothetical protein
MAATIDATVGGASANSYNLLATALTFFEGALNATDFTGATTDEQNRALISAAYRLDQEDWAGQKADADQALAFPRIGIYDRDGLVYASDAIPTPIQRAHLKLANAMLGGDLLADTGLEGFINLKVGPLDVTPRLRTAGELPSDVMNEIRHLLETAGEANFLVYRG